MCSSASGICAFKPTAARSLKRGTERAQKVLFFDARQIFRQLDRAHRDFTDEQLEFLANIVRLYRGEEPETAGDSTLFAGCFPNNEYVDVPGLCKIATLVEIELQGWSLNPGRYVGTEVDDLDDEVFEEKLAADHAELRERAARAAKLEQGVDQVLTRLLSR
jgi:type I restriction enzyme M protein